MKVIKRVKKFVLPAAAAVGVVLCLSSSPVRAQGSPLEAEIAKVEEVSVMLQTLVTAFTTVLITPMGVSAAIKIFKTLVLFNL